MSKFKFTIDGKAYEVSVTDTDTNMASVEVNGTSYNVQYEPQAGAPVRRASKAAAPGAAPAAAPAAAPTGAGTVVAAPLPGTVTSIAVSAGSAVKKGDVLMVMEAMKMENDIRADRDGVVKSVLVAAGKTVMQGDALIEIA